MNCQSMNVCRNPRLQPLPQMRVQARPDCSLIAEQYCLVLLCTPIFGCQQGIMSVKATVQVQINSQSSRVNHIYHWICMCHWRKGGTFRVLPFGMLVPGFGSGQLGDLCRNTGAMASEPQGVRKALPKSPCFNWLIVLTGRHSVSAKTGQGTA